MGVSDCLAILNSAIIMMMKIAAPMLLLSMLIGLIIAIFQAATQIHEQTITFVPKLFIILIILMVAGSWMMSNLTDFTADIFRLVAEG
ncbi:MAG: flagellar biosynthesis protein FliQ [Clostridia bacterium]|nr:flagellar biosynthesis protein FliQ [Clostridia bacterium]